VNNEIAIDLSKLDDIEINADKKTARVGGGCRLGNVDLACEKYGLATTFGTNPDTGVGGLSLGGGFGFMARKHGFTVDNVLEAEVVLQDGKCKIRRHARGSLPQSAFDNLKTGTVVIANQDSNADLFWALRGGGGNFGIVTHFTFQLHPMNGAVLETVIHLFEKINALDFFAHFDEFFRTAPREVTGITMLTTIPLIPPFLSFLVPLVEMVIPTIRQKVILVPSAYLDLSDEPKARSALNGLTGWGKPFICAHDKGSYHRKLQTMASKSQQPGYYYEKACFVKSDPKMFEVLLKAFMQVPNKSSSILIAPLYGKMQEISIEDTAFAHRDADYWIAVLCKYDPKNDPDREAAIRWAKQTINDLNPYSLGSFANELSMESSLESVYRSNLAKLQRLKKLYDPDNFFRFNNNISGPASNDSVLASSEQKQVPHSSDAF
jgi:hypothetical protein